MKRHLVSVSDREFKTEFERCATAPSEFGHQSHLRIAYIYLCEDEPEAAYSRMRSSLLKFLAHHRIDPMKYHETLTRAWMMAVDHFMSGSPRLFSSSEFLDRNPILSQPEIMLTHYSKEKLFSDAARANFIAPDLQPIPPPRG